MPEPTKKPDYEKHYKKFQKSGLKLREYCGKTRNPRLVLGPAKSAFKRIKKRVAEGSPKTKKSDPAETPSRPRKTPTGKRSKRGIRNLPSLPKGLKLSAKRQAFADEYLVCRNQTQAYMKVYGCSYLSALKNAYRLMDNEGIRLYIEYHRSLARSQAQVDLQKLVGVQKEVAFYDLDQEVNLDLGGLDEYGKGDLPEETKKYLRNTRVRYITVKNDDGSETLKQVVEYDIGLKYTEGEKQRAKKELRSLLIDKSSDNAIDSTNEQVQQWWREFLNPTNGTPRLSGLGFAQRLESIKHEVPPIIEAQAKAELAVLRERSLLVSQDPIEMEKGISTKDLVLQLVEEAAKQGDRGQLIELAKTMAQMKITDKKFGFNLFSELAEMVGTEGEIGWED